MLSNPLEMNRFSIITTTSLQQVIYPLHAMTSWLFPPCSFLGSQFGLTFRFALLPSYPHASAQFVFPYCFSGPRTQARMDFSPNLPDTPKTPRRLDPPLYIAPPMVFSARPWPNALLQYTLPLPIPGQQSPPHSRSNSLPHCP